MNKGFTLIEVLIVVAIAVILFSVAVTPFFGLNSRQALLKESSNVVAILEHSRSMTLSSKGGEPHGVHLESDRVVLFTGDAYVLDDPDNISIRLNSLVSISNVSLTGGATDVVFELQTGETNVSGSVTLSLVASSTQAKTININSTGIIDSDL